MAARSRETGLAALEKARSSFATLPDLQAREARSKTSTCVIAGFTPRRNSAATQITGDPIPICKISIACVAFALQTPATGRFGGRVSARKPLKRIYLYQ